MVSAHAQGSQFPRHSVLFSLFISDLPNAMLIDQFYPYPSEFTMNYSYVPRKTFFHMQTNAGVHLPLLSIMP
jgi:hypothetical protein